MNPTSKTQQPIRPTLYIGLGGTGKEVLLRLRRRFYERFRVRSLPCTQFLWIDTDIRDCDARGDNLDAAMLAVGFAMGNSLEALAGAWLIRRFVAERPTFSWRGGPGRPGCLQATTWKSRSCSIWAGLNSNARSSPGSSRYSPGRPTPRLR